MRWGSGRSMRGSQGVHRDGVDNILRGSTKIKAWRARRCGRELQRNCKKRKTTGYAKISVEIEEELGSTGKDMYKDDDQEDYHGTKKGNN